MFQDFDVSEMSMSSLMMATAQGNDDWVGIPIFTTRNFFHTEILVRNDTGIDEPKDLKGKRVGVPEYQQTAALWARGALARVRRAPEEMESGWSGADAQPRRRRPASSRRPADVNQMPIEKSLGRMIVAGELDATIHYLRDNNLVDRWRIDLEHHPDVRTLFPDRLAEGVRYHKKTGIFPINHGMVVRREIAEKHPWVVLNLLKAYGKANEIANQQRIAQVEYHVWSGAFRPRPGRHCASRRSATASRPTAKRSRWRRRFARAGTDAAPDEARGTVCAERDGTVAAGGAGTSASTARRPSSPAPRAGLARRWRRAFGTPAPIGVADVDGAALQATRATAGQPAAAGRSACPATSRMSPTANVSLTRR